MTTIATDGKTMASDSQVQSTFVYQSEYHKLYHLHDGSVVGFCGEVRFWLPVLKWLNGGDKPDFKSDQFGALILRLNGSVGYICNDLFSEECTPPYAIGSGARYAMAAMLAGKTPVDAVKIASKLDSGTGGGVVCEKPKKGG